MNPAQTTPANDREERQAQLDDDYRWGLTNAELRRQFGGQVVAVHGHTLWGAGSDHLEALRSARERPHCPDRTRLAFVVVPYLVADPGSEEFAWCFRDDVQRQYGGLVAAVYQQAVLGAGNDRDAARREALRQPGCPAPEQLRYVIIPSVLPDDGSL